jgi:hypothetical protein
MTLGSISTALQLNERVGRDWRVKAYSRPSRTGEDRRLTSSYADERPNQRVLLRGASA